MKIVHLAVGQAKEKPVLFALAEDGRAYRFDETGHQEEWVAMPAIPDPPGWEPPSTTVHLSGLKD